MNVYVFPGQGAQFRGMGADLYASNTIARDIFEQANDILGYRITDVMFEGSDEELKQTKITQPAIFLHSVVKARLAGDAFQPHAVAGHSLGEFSALTAVGGLDFEQGLKLVQQRALAMQAACEAVPGTMAAILGLEDALVAQVCSEIEDLVVPANYNSPGQLVISGSIAGVERACELLKEAGAKRALILPVGGAFHSPLMEPARMELEAALEATVFSVPRCPIYQNVSALPETDPEIIKANLIQQLTAPVLWTQTVRNMLADGAVHFTEVGGTGAVLRGLIRQVNREVASDAI